MGILAALVNITWAYLGLRKIILYIEPLPHIFGSLAALQWRNIYRTKNLFKKCFQASITPGAKKTCILPARFAPEETTSHRLILFKGKNITFCWDTYGDNISDVVAAWSEETLGVHVKCGVVKGEEDIIAVIRRDSLKHRDLSTISVQRKIA